MAAQSALILGAVVASVIGLAGVAELVDAPYGNLKQAEPVTVSYVDINSYLGTWYEQARIPFFFERGCTYTKAIYSLNPDKTMKVNNTCIRDGKEVGSIGKAVPEDPSNSKLKVEFVQTLDIGAQYWIVRLAKDYTYSVVTSPNYRYLWILYRNPVMPQPLYDAIVADLKRDGYPVEKLVRTQQ